jgi:hypothetical protein
MTKVYFFVFKLICFSTNSTEEFCCVLECSKENDYTQDLNDCRNFYRCLNNELVSFQCPMETIFDSILKMCVCSYPENDCPVVSSTNSSNSPNPTVSNRSKEQPFFKN